ncbi:hypothetical protein [Kutzneria sp. CA-103260]|uniref:hypothetical protein n=1 Tax=Kutzneria sp. CA-103260 TaxID=2802641 RepID=UPI001BA6BD9D|nr:hypothetical protein [Kutzneria sp. CA-103260]
MVTASACAAFLALVIILPLALVLGATGAIGGGLFTALTVAFVGKSFSHRHRDGDAS